MKYRTTAKYLRENGGLVVKCGYCDLATLLRDESPVAYTCGVYGWNFDVYEVCGITICTGYRGMVGRRANGIREYEEKAKALEKKYNQWTEYDKLKRARRRLLEKFCEQA